MAQSPPGSKESMSQIPHYTVIGHIGWDKVTLADESSSDDLVGGAVWHWLAGFSPLGGRVSVLTWGSQNLRREVMLAAPDHDWQGFVLRERDARFVMRYSSPETLEDIKVDVEPIPTEVLDAVQAVESRLHVCTMPASEFRKTLLLSPARSVSVQVHASVLPSLEVMCEVGVGRQLTVFLSRHEFLALMGAGVDSRVGSDLVPPELESVRWIVTSRIGCWILEKTDRDVFVPWSPREEVFDVTAAGDVFSGAFVSVAHRTDPRTAAKYAMSVAEISTHGWTSTLLVRERE